jgi:hypothetical protein
MTPTTVKAQNFGKESAIRTPATTPYFADCIMYRFDVLATDALAQNVYTGDNASNSGLGRIGIDRHGSILAPKGNQSVGSGVYNSSRIILSTADGHAESSKLSNLTTYIWSATWPN